MTTTIIRFPGHKWAHCSKECSGCCLCHGGLASCVVCGGGEGSLPTDCPGYRMTMITADKVYAGELDYRRGQGWVPRMSKAWEGFR